MGIDGLTPTITFVSTFDAAGRRSSLAATVGSTADFKNDYTYDDIGRLTRLTQGSQGGGNTVATKRIDFSYNLAGQFTSLDRYADSAGTQQVSTTAYSYDGIGRLTSLLHSLGLTDFAGYDYVYDRASRITEIDSLVDGLTTYPHDFTGQLTGADHTGSTDEYYQYDENGNRVMTGYSVGDNNQLLSDGTYTYEYDDEGNRTAKETIATGERVEYQWDHRNRLTKVTFKNSAGAVIKTVDQSYDYLNRWVRSSTDPDGAGSASVTDRFFVYEDGQVVLQFDGGSASDMTNRYVWGPMVDQILADEQVTSLSSAGNLIWPLTDHLNTVRDLADRDESTGAVSVTNHRVYDSFGQLVSETNAAVDEVFGFTARFFDEASGLQNNWNRWYDAEIGRWICEDPIGFLAGEANLNGYLMNRILAGTDPLCLFDFGNVISRNWNNITKPYL